MNQNQSIRLARVARAFAKSNGVVIKVGDASHPNAVEVVTCYPDWAERLLLRRIRSTIFSTCYYDKDQREIVSRMSRQDLLSLISEPVQAGWLPDVEKGEVFDFRDEGSFQKMVDGGPPIMKQHSHMYPPINRGVQKRISEEYKREYERVRGSIWRYLHHCVDFVGAVDSPLVESTAKLFAN
jgi:hypothetical protein